MDVRYQWHIITNRHGSCEIFIHTQGNWSSSNAHSAVAIQVSEDSTREISATARKPQTITPQVTNNIQPLEHPVAGLNLGLSIDDVPEPLAVVKRDHRLGWLRVALGILLWISDQVQVSQNGSSVLTSFSHHYSFPFAIRTIMTVVVIVNHYQAFLLNNQMQSIISHKFATIINQSLPSINHFISLINNQQFKQPIINQPLINRFRSWQSTIYSPFINHSSQPFISTSPQFIHHQLTIPSPSPGFVTGATSSGCILASASATRITVAWDGPLGAVRVELRPSWTATRQDQFPGTSWG